MAQKAPEGGECSAACFFWGTSPWCQCSLGYGDGQAEATDPCSPGWSLAWFSGSLSAVPGFAGQPAALSLAGTSGTRGLLGGVLGSSRMFLLDFFAIVCME